MSAPGHRAVMPAEMLAAIAPADGDDIIDATFGAGGHSRAFLEAADCRVFALDRDGAAVRDGQDMVAAYAGRLCLVQGRLSRLDMAFAESGLRQVSGVAMDLGVSSMQLDDAMRGFSIQRDGPLDMRMGPDGPSAADLVNGAGEAELADIIHRFGEERRARRIARAIVAARTRRPIARTGELARIVEAAIAAPRARIHPATRTFQALRIAVNDELGELAAGLEAAEQALAGGGRLAVIAFHSLEDRAVKRFLDARSGRQAGGSRHRPRPRDTAPPASFRLPSRGAQQPSEKEIERNPRARSARLRAAVRTEAPPWPRTPAP